MPRPTWMTPRCLNRGQIFLESNYWRNPRSEVTDSLGDQTSNWSSFSWIGVWKRALNRASSSTPSPSISLTGYIYVYAPETLHESMGSIDESLSNTSSDKYPPTKDMTWLDVNARLIEHLCNILQSDGAAPFRTRTNWVMVAISSQILKPHLFKSEAITLIRLLTQQQQLA